jgi:CubicO group peptidase (beta-lactamase class C family)
LTDRETRSKSFDPPLMNGPHLESRCGPFKPRGRRDHPISMKNTFLRFRTGWVALCLTGLVASARAEETCDLECSLAKLLTEERLAGAVYGLVDGDVTRSGAVGFAHRPAATPLRADAKVHVGSVAKTFVALGVLRLVSQGRVDLDAPLDPLLPGVEIDNPWAPRTKVTLRHLLDHTSGLDDMRLWQIFTLRADPRAPLARAVDGPADLLRVRSEPGSHFSYSNMGFTLAAMAIESVTGERYESWLDRELLGPLGMADSTFEFRSQTGPDPDARLAWGHQENFEPVAALPVWLRPATQFTTTAHDMTLAMRFLTSDGRLGGAAFIDEALLRAMGRASTEAAKAGLSTGYGLGLATRDRHGAVGLCHLGGIVGFRAAFCVYPGRKGFFVSYNSDDEAANYLRIDELFVKALGVSSPVAPTTSGSPAAEWRGRYVRTPSRFESFRYFDLLLDSVVLDVEDGALVLRRLFDEPQVLVPAGPNLFRAPDRTTASHVLLPARDGAPGIGDANGSFRRVGELRFYGLWSSLVLGAIGLLGWLVLIPSRAFAQREPLWQPATFALVSLLVPLPLFAMQPFVAIGDATPASLALYAATLALPILMVAQIVRAVRNRHRTKAWALDVVLAVFVLQWCVVLAAWGILPFATWR